MAICGVVNYIRLKYVLVVSLSALVTYLLSLYWCLTTNGNQELFPVVLEPTSRKGNISDTLMKQYAESFRMFPHRSQDMIRHQQNADVVFFNRIPKTGSEMLVLLMQWLQRQNGFRHIRLKNTVDRFLTEEEQLALAAEIGEKLNERNERLVSFDRHLYFTNFTRLGLKMPLYINMVRDPVDKVASRFYYRRVTPRPGGFTPPDYHKPEVLLPFFSLEECLEAMGKECTFIDGLMYDLSIPYFCGHQNYCRQLNNVEAFITAKRNAEEWYSVVGVLEDLNATLAVFEATLPKFFLGVTDLYFKKLDGFHHNKNRQRPEDIAPWAREKLRNNLTLEYEFYYFLIQKLKNQFFSLKANS